jgi:uncharacterized protein (TIGR02594 family)
MLNRRVCLMALGYLGLPLSTRSVLPFQGGSSSTRLPSGIGTEPDFNGPLPRPEDTLGRQRALDPEIKMAEQIIASAPIGPVPIDVALFFLAVGNGSKGEAWRPYVKAWPVRWNPLIVNFFTATKTVPEGDETAWCAAFVNWCFKQAGRGVATDNASSGSFRTFGSVTSKPSAGDIVVFERTHPKTEDERHQGHVGFFVKDYGAEVEVLGGNQIVGHEKSHMICLRRLLKEGPVLTLNSFRTDSRLRS